MKDEDPYVRKTAAVCVAKLHDINPQLVEDQGFLDLLRDLLSDSNPMVVANAVAAICEISEVSPTASRVLELNSQTVNKLLTALNECTEWGQVFILDSISNYNPKDDKEAQNICERVAPRLAHANAAVVLSAVKVIIKFLEMIDPSCDFVTNLTKKLAPPLVTLLSGEPEIQYVALRNINLIVQKRSDILKNELKVFFVKYNDPIYVKLEKLDIMIRLTNASNIQQVLAELKEYATEVDVDFVRRAVRAIGRCAIKVEASAEKCVQTLQDLIQTKVNYVVQEAIVVIKDIFRKYPNQYERIIGTLCENLESLDEPEAKASMIWILGEYAERIDNADELLETFLTTFHDENTQVQLQLLTAIVKLFLKKPQDTQALVQQVLSLSTQDSDNPDLRDRGYIYWRLLSTDPQLAKDVVLAEKPLISEETDLLEPTLLDELLCHISSLASVYHKPPSAFIEGRVPLNRRTLPPRAPGSAQSPTQGEAVARPDAKPQSTVIPGQESALVDLLSLDFGGPSVPPTSIAAPPQGTGQPGGQIDLLSDLDTLIGGGAPGGSNLESTTPIPTQSSMYSNAPAAAAANTSGGGGGGLEGLFSSSATTASAFYSPPKEVWLPPARAKGLEVRGTFCRRGGNIYMDVTITNKALQAMSDFAVQFNKNSFGLSPAQPLKIQSPLLPNQHADSQMALSTGGPVQKMDPLNNLQVAVKNNVDVFYFECQIPFHVYFIEDGQMDKHMFIETWKQIPGQNEANFSLTASQSMVSGGGDAIEQRLKSNNVFTINKRQVDGQEMLYQSIKFINGVWVLAEVKLSPGNPTVTLSLKSNQPVVYPGVKLAYEMLLATP